MAETLMDPEWKGTVTSLCEQYGVARSTLYRWMDKPEFQRYLEQLVDKYADSELATVWKALIARCAIGDVQAMKLYFELRSQGKADGKGMEVQIIDDISDDPAE